MLQHSFGVALARFELLSPRLALVRARSARSWRCNAARFFVKIGEIDFGLNARVLKF